MNPQVFGKEHLIYIAVSIILAVAACILVKKFAKTEKVQNIVMRAAGGLLFAVIFANRLALVFEYETTNWLKLLTDSFCSTSSYVLALALLLGKRDNSVLHFVWYISLIGGILTTFYPNFIGQNPSFMYPPTILGMMHHTLAGIIVIVMFLTKYIHISIRKWQPMVIGLMAYLTYGAFLYFVLGYGNPFYMASPAIDGTPFTAWVLLPLNLAVYAAILLFVELARKLKKKKQAKQAQVEAEAKNN